MTFFVRIKHWQLFTALFLVPVVVLFNLPDDVVLNESPKTLNVSIIIMSAYMSAILLWIFSVGYKLYKKAIFVSDLKMHYIFFILSLIIITAFIAYFFWVVLSYTDQKTMPEFVFPFFLFMGLLGAISVFYCWAFIAKTLRMVELKRKVNKKEWFSDALTFFFYPVGMWILQPRVNKIFK